MTQYPKSPQSRVTDAVPDIRKRIARLEARTSSIDAGQPLAMLAGTIDPAYTSGNPQVTIQGDTSLTGPYACLASYTPVASDQVYLVPYHAPGAGGLTTWIVAGTTARPWVNVSGGVGFASAQWSDAGAGQPLAGFKLIGYATLAIRMRVVFTSNGTTGLSASQLIFTLPAAFRPATDHTFTAAAYNSPAIVANRVPSIEVAPSGTVTVFNVTSVITNGTLVTIAGTGNIPLD